MVVVSCFQVATDSNLHKVKKTNGIKGKTEKGNEDI